MEVRVFNKNGEHISEGGGHITSDMTPGTYGGEGLKSVGQISKETGANARKIYKFIRDNGIKDSEKGGVSGRPVKLYNKAAQQKIMEGLGLSYTVEEPVISGDISNKTVDDMLEKTCRVRVSSDYGSEDGKLPLHKAVPYGAPGRIATDAPCSVPDKKPSPVMAVLAFASGLVLAVILLLEILSLTQKIDMIHEDLRVISEAYSAAEESGWQELAEEQESMEHGWLGVTVSDGTAVGGDDKISGAIIIEVVEGSPAEKVGLSQNDIIIGADGITMENAADFIKYLQGCSSGDNVRLNVIKSSSGKIEEIPVVLVPYGEITE